MPAMPAPDASVRSEERSSMGAPVVACRHPCVRFAQGASELKGEDVLLAAHQRPWPGTAAAKEGARAGSAAAALLQGAASADLDSAKALSCGRPLAGDGEGSSHHSASGHGGSAAFPPGYCAACGQPDYCYSFFAVFDGHNGGAAAKMCAEHVIELVEGGLPQGSPPEETDPDFDEFADAIQRALAEAVAALNLLFAQRGVQAGCTATLVLQVGWLVTVANLGDSRAYLDTGCESVMLTVDHRVATHKGERRRVEAMGALIAPIDQSGSGPARSMVNGVGPLRIWPGGLCLSRAVGDFDVGDSVIPFPHVTQVLVPPTGGRVTLASDGVWDAHEKMSRVANMSRGWPLNAYPQRMIQSIVRAYGGLRDDTSLIVVDITPQGLTFPEVHHQVSSKALAVFSSGFGRMSSAPPAASGGAAAAAAQGSVSGGGCLCFGGGVKVSAAAARAAATAAAAREPSVRDPSVRYGYEPSVRSKAALAAVAGTKPKVELLANLDVAAVMGLMPDEDPEPPLWYGPEVGDALFALASDAAAAWQAAQTQHGRRLTPATPATDALSLLRTWRRGRPQAPAREAAAEEGSAGTCGIDGKEEEDGEELARRPRLEPAGSGGGMRRAASMFFPNSTASDTDYGSKFRYGPGDFSVRAGGVLAGGGTGPGDYSVRGGALGRPGSNDPSVRGGGGGGSGSTSREPSVRGGAGGSLHGSRAGDPSTHSAGGSMHSGSGTGRRRVSFAPGFAPATSCADEDEDGALLPLRPGLCSSLETLREGAPFEGGQAGARPSALRSGSNLSDSARSTDNALSAVAEGSDAGAVASGLVPVRVVQRTGAAPKNGPVAPGDEVKAAACGSSEPIPVQRLAGAAASSLLARALSAAGGKQPLRRHDSPSELAGLGSLGS